MKVRAFASVRAAPEDTELVFETDYVVVQCVTGRASRQAGAAMLERKTQPMRVSVATPRDCRHSLPCG